MSYYDWASAKTLWKESPYKESYEIALSNVWNYSLFCKKTNPNVFYCHLKYSSRDNGIPDLWDVFYFRLLCVSLFSFCRPYKVTLSVYVFSSSFFGSSVVILPFILLFVQGWLAYGFDTHRGFWRRYRLSAIGIGMEGAGNLQAIFRLDFRRDFDEVDEEKMR